MKKILSVCFGAAGTAALMTYFGFLWLNRHVFLWVTEDILFGFSLKIWMEILFFAGLALVSAALLLVAKGATLKMPFGRPARPYLYLGGIGTLVWMLVWTVQTVFSDRLSLAALWVCLSLSIAAELCVTLCMILHILRHKTSVTQWCLGGSAALCSMLSLALRLSLTFGLFAEEMILTVTLVAEIAFYLRLCLFAAALCCTDLCFRAAVIWGSALCSVQWLGYILLTTVKVYHADWAYLPMTGFTALCNAAAVLFFVATLIWKRR